MDARLAELYGTNQPDEADLEKLAAAEFADGLAEDEELDLDEVDEETLEQLALEVVEGEGQEKVAEGEEDEEQEGEEEEEPAAEQEKVAEADQLGRIMAHAYVQELRGIQKEAKFDPKDLAKVPFGHKVRGAARQAGKYVVGKAKGLHAQRKGAFRQAKEMAGEAKRGKMGDVKLSKGQRLRHLAGAAKKVAPEAGAAAAAAGGAAYKKKKAASATPALDALAAQRAQEILAEAGVTEEQTEGTQNPAYDALAQEVEARAIRMLQSEGYEIAES